jgi:hypothetical protein
MRKHIFLISLVLGSKYRCKQLLSLLANVKSRTRTPLTDEHLQGCMQITTREIKLDTGRRLKQT